MEKLEALLRSIEQQLPDYPHRVLPLAQQLLQRARELEQPFFEAQARRALAVGFGYEGKMEEATIHAGAALDICQKLGDDRLLLRCVVTRGALFLGQGEHQPARELYQQYLPRSEAPELADERTKLLNNLGVIARRQGDYPAALKYFLECVDIYRRQASIPPLAYTLHNLAEVYIWLEMHDLAEDCVLEGLSILDEQQVTHGRGYLLNDLGLLERLRGEPEKARKLHVEAARLAREQKDRAEWSHSLSLEAACLDEQDPRAIELLEQAVELTRACGDRHLCAEALLQLGERHLDSARWAQARGCLEEAERLAKETDSDELFCQANELLARLNASTGDHRQAYCLLLENMSLRDRIKGARAAQRIQAVTIPWELRAIEAEKELLRLRNAELESLSRHDHLTGLANRRFLQQRLGELYREGELALLILDLDFFKRINDHHSHAIGDRVLQQAARLMQALTPESGLAARFGGEEFVILLPGHDLQQASRLAEQLREGIAGHDWSGLVDAMQVTVSIGVAHSAETDTDSDLLQLADTRLYQAKRSGRNRVSAVVDQSFS